MDHSHATPGQSAQTRKNYAESPQTSPVSGLSRPLKQDIAEHHELTDDAIADAYLNTLNPLRAYDPTPSRHEPGSSRPDTNTINKVIAASPQGTSCGMTGELVGNSTCDAFHAWPQSQSDGDVEHSEEALGLPSGSFNHTKSHFNIGFSKRSFYYGFDF